MKAHRTYWVENATPTTPFFGYKKAPWGPKNTFSLFLFKNGLFWEAYHGCKKGYLAKTTVRKPSYQNTIGQRILKKYFFCHFFRQVEFFFKNKIRKNPNLVDPSCGYAGGSPPGRGVENTRQEPGYPFCDFISKNILVICSQTVP